MSSDVRFERLVEKVLDESAPAAAPDELISAVLAATHDARRWPAWLARVRERPLRVNDRVVVGSPTLRAAYAASVAAIALVIGIGGVLGAASILVPREEPGPTPTPTVTPTASPLPIRIDSTLFQPAFTFQAPLGWLKVDEGADYFTFASPDGAGTVVFHTNPIIASDENECEGLAASGGATTVNGIIASLSGDPRLATSAPIPVAVGDLTGRSLDAQVDPSWTGTCSWSGGHPAALLLTSRVGPGPIFGLQQSEQARIIVVDVGGDVVSIVVESPDPSMFEMVTPEAMQMIESIRFGN